MSRSDAEHNPDEPQTKGSQQGYRDETCPSSTTDHQENGEPDLIEIPQHRLDQLEDLEERFDKLCELIIGDGSLDGALEVQKDVFPAIDGGARPYSKVLLGHQAVIDTLQDDVDELENETQDNGYEPPSKIGKILYLITENFDRWSWNIGGKPGLATDVKSSRGKRRGIKNLHQHLERELDEDYGESYNYADFGRAAGVLEDLDGWWIEEDGERKIIRRDRGDES